MQALHKSATRLQRFQNCAQASASSRRESLQLALTGIAAVAVFALSDQHAVAAECELTTGERGLQFCELQEGSGDAAKPGTLIRCGFCIT